MTLLGIATESFVLRKMVNQAPIALFMATIGLAFFIEGLAPLLWGNEVRPLDVGTRRRADRLDPRQLQHGGQQFRPTAAGLALALVALLALFFQYTRVGRALRAVADDHQAALSIGIPLQHIWALVWAVAGFVALVAGMLWGARNGVQFALTFTALKALPVLILGGFTSVPGAIVGGLIIGASEKLAEIYIPPVLADMFGGNFGGIEDWFPYVLALLFLLVRPEGLFGETAHRSGLRPCFISESGQFKTSYAADQQIFPIRQDRIGIGLLLAGGLRRRAPGGRQYWFNAILIPFLIFALAALGLNILTGYAGQLSLGSAAFMAVGRLSPPTTSRCASRHADSRLLLARRADGGGRGHSVRPALLAHQGLLPGGGDAGGAVLHCLVPDQVSLLVQLLHRPA